MKPSELFPGAVVMCKSICMVVKSPGTEYIVMMDGLIFKHEDLQPLPISPAVLRGLGFEKTRNYTTFEFGDLIMENTGAFWQLASMGEHESIVTDCHQLQALSLHLYGVELVWNQSEYEKAMQEELS